MARTKPARVNRARARWWRIADDKLILFHPDGYNETSVPVAHLADESRMCKHYLRLSDKRWVRPCEIEELKAIARGPLT